MELSAVQLMTQMLRKELGKAAACVLQVKLWWNDDERMERATLRKAVLSKRAAPL
jgi:hypothetical protein